MYKILFLNLPPNEYAIRNSVTYDHISRVYYGAYAQDDEVYSGVVIGFYSESTPNYLTAIELSKKGLSYFYRPISGGVQDNVNIGFLGW